MNLTDEELRIVLKAMEYTRPRVQEGPGFNELARKVFEAAGYSVSASFANKIYER